MTPLPLGCVRTLWMPHYATVISFKCQWSPEEDRAGRTNRGQWTITNIVTHFTALIHAKSSKGAYCPRWCEFKMEIVMCKEICAHQSFIHSHTLCFSVIPASSAMTTCPGFPGYCSGIHRIFMLSWSKMQLNWIEKIALNQVVIEITETCTWPTLCCSLLVLIWH